MRGKSYVRNAATEFDFTADSNNGLVNNIYDVLHIFPAPGHPKVFVKPSEGYKGDPLLVDLERLDKATP